MLNLLVKNIFGGKITLSCIFSRKVKHFSSFHVKKSISQNYKIAVSYFAFEAILEWCPVKVSVLQKAILKCSSSELLAKIFEKYL